MTSEQDTARRFHIETAGVRGAIVRLDDSWNEILRRADYPPPLARCLGQFAAASALLAADIDFRGSVSVQLRGGAAVSLVFAECTATGRLRGLAQWQGSLPPVIAPADLNHDAMFAITIERGNDQPRFQGLVPLEGASIDAAFEAYFRRSEQLPTALRLCVDQGSAAAMLVQQVPTVGGHTVREDSLEFERIAMLFATLTDAELLQLPAETLLRRLFAEDDIRLFPATPLRFGCTCSRQRVVGALAALGADEILTGRDAAGGIDVSCEFCNQQYRFDAVDLAQLYADPAAAPGSTRMQ